MLPTARRAAGRWRAALPRHRRAAHCWHAAARACVRADGRARSAVRHPRGAHVAISWVRLHIRTQCVLAKTCGAGQRTLQVLLRHGAGRVQVCRPALLICSQAATMCTPLATDSAGPCTGLQTAGRGLTVAVMWDMQANPAAGRMRSSRQWPTAERARPWARTIAHVVACQQITLLLCWGSAACHRAAAAPCIPAHQAASAVGGSGAALFSGSSGRPSRTARTRAPLAHGCKGGLHTAHAVPLLQRSERSPTCDCGRSERRTMSARLSGGRCAARYRFKSVHDGLGWRARHPGRLHVQAMQTCSSAENVNAEKIGAVKGKTQARMSARGTSQHPRTRPRLQ